MVHFLRGDLNSNWHLLMHLHDVGVDYEVVVDGVGDAAAHHRRNVLNDDSDCYYFVTQWNFVGLYWYCSVVERLLLHY